MLTVKQAAMQAALDAIDFYLNEIGCKESNDPHYAPEDYSALETAAKLRAALAQPEQDYMLHPGDKISESIV